MSFVIHKGEIKVKNWDTLHANVDILKTVLDAYHYFDLKSNLTGSTVRNAGETGDINRQAWFPNG